MLRTHHWIGAVSLSLALGYRPEPARADNKYLQVPKESVAASSPASRYANLDNDEVHQELSRRGIPFKKAKPPAPGVRFPIRLTGPLHGVHIHSVLPEEQRKKTPFEILDGRLALALDDFSRILAIHDIVEAVHFTIYRPAKTNAKDPVLYRHPAGLAIDIGAVKKRSGHWLAVGPHWPTQIGGKTCGSGARSLTGRSGRELMSLVCEAADQRLFHYILTPHFDLAHSDHLHLEVKPAVKWFLVN